MLSKVFLGVARVSSIIVLISVLALIVSCALAFTVQGVFPEGAARYWLVGLSAAVALVFTALLFVFWVLAKLWRRPAD